MTNKTTISVLLPTRGRTDALERSLMGLINHSAHPECLQIMLGFDDDDTESFEYFQRVIQPEIEEAGAEFICLGFKRMGYQRLHEYVNKLAAKSTGDWLFFWNDDAIMQTQDWDERIRDHDGRFALLRMPTHNAHPYAIFPIVPKEWFQLFGYLSLHQLSDAWISQIGYMLDIVVNIDVEVLHDRHDITGNNHDDTYQERTIFEGRHTDPRDFNYITMRGRRIDDAMKIAVYLKSNGYDISWFEAVALGKQDPWAKMCGPEYDPNGQLKVYNK